MLKRNSNKGKRKWFLGAHSKNIFQEDDKEINLSCDLNNTKADDDSSDEEVLHESIDGGSDELEWESSEEECIEEQSSDDEDSQNTSDVEEANVNLEENISDRSQLSEDENTENDDSSDSNTEEEKVNESENEQKDKNASHDDIVKDSDINDKVNLKVRKKNDLNLANTSDSKIDSDISYEDTSDEEDIRNTIGNIPVNWYDEYKHIGYDWYGKKIMKPNIGDQLDNFLKKMEDPNFWRTVKDKQTGQDVILSDNDIDLIKRLEGHKIPDAEFNEYAPWIEWFTSEVMKMPLRKFPEHKRSFVPSKHEMRKVSKYVHALKMGWMKTRKAIKKERKLKEQEGPQFYMLWTNDDVAEEMRRIHCHIPAPKRALPDHSESYNPPEEYLFNEREMKQWDKDKRSLGNKKLHFIPQKYNSLREVPAYSRYIKERFMRCLDLYMCPRAIKMRLTIEPEDLVPQLPSPKDLQPFPTTLSLVFEGHNDMVRSISIDPTGQLLASVSDDMSLKIWEIQTTRCLKTIPIGGIGRWVEWCPNSTIRLVAVAADRKVLLINPLIGNKLAAEKIDSLLEGELLDDDKIVSERVSAAVQWEVVNPEQWQTGLRSIINHFKEVKQVSWHGKGDYFASVMPDGANRAVIIHQLSRRKSQLPFSKSKGLVQCVLFHPTRPFFFVATQRNIRIYDLVKQEMVKKLYSNSQWISSMAIHPGGDNLIVGTYDRKVLWFDLDLSTKPYKSIRLHNGGVRAVAIHKRYPLFATGADDKSVIVSHGMVYNDLLQNALIVPLKRLSYHGVEDDFSLLDVKFHPNQPWVFSSGADKKIMLYS